MTDPSSGGVVSVNRPITGVDNYANVAEAVLVAALHLSEGDVILVEQHVDLSEVLGVPDLGGTPDLVLIYYGGMEVWDLKTGRIEVDPEENHQLILYALGILNKYMAAFQIRDVRLVIHQHGRLKEWTDGD